MSAAIAVFVGFEEAHGSFLARFADALEAARPWLPDGGATPEERVALLAENLAKLKALFHHVPTIHAAQDLLFENGPAFFESEAKIGPPFRELRLQLQFKRLELLRQHRNLGIHRTLRSRNTSSRRLDNLTSSRASGAASVTDGGVFRQL